jgi:hypothetical protein
MRNLPVIAIIMSLLFCAGCSQQQAQLTELKSYAVNDLDGLIAQSNVQLDQNVSNDSMGSLKITVPESTTINLYETGDLDAEDCKLIYETKVKTRDFKGQIYLEMWCSFAGMGDYFSRNLQSPITNAPDWLTRETYFILQKGQNPNNVRLNLIINGTGTVWVDDIKLLKGPLS